MTNIKEAYCSYKVSKLLKEKGFDETSEYCYAFFDENDIRVLHLNPQKRAQDLRNLRFPYVTHQMAMRWLREEKGIYIDVFIDDDSEMPWTYNIHKELRDGTTECVYHHHGNYYPLTDGYEEAVEAAIKYCLENLI